MTDEIVTGAIGDMIGGLMAGMITAVGSRTSKRFQPEPQAGVHVRG